MEPSHKRKSEGLEEPLSERKEPKQKQFGKIGALYFRRDRSLGFEEIGVPPTTYLRVPSCCQAVEPAKRIIEYQLVNMLRELKNIKLALGI